MGTYRKVLSYETKSGGITYICGDAQRALNESGLQEGLLCIFVKGSTGALVFLERDAELEPDLKEALERIAPSGVRYHHDQKWGDGNGHSHIRASILGGSITIPFVSGKLDLGRWQQLALVENDIRDRHREVIIQIVGE
ncbi:MAG: hypothetical protein PWQ88_416 [Candidatus Methanomethylophilaceae archaeon]|nr:hypothetical protein [Candidatus Methanomethylophilaceae archaeon]MDI3541145.1 hypothetical protein [Candidatus Methanomethylophilaceae archaeon]